MHAHFTTVPQGSMLLFLIPVNHQTMTNSMKLLAMLEIVRMNQLKQLLLSCWPSVNTIWKGYIIVTYRVFYGNLYDVATQLLGTNGSMHSRCVPGPFSSSPLKGPVDKASLSLRLIYYICYPTCMCKRQTLKESILSVVITSKLSRSRHLGTWAAHKRHQSVTMGEKLVLVASIVRHSPWVSQIASFCWPS